MSKAFVIKNKEGKYKEPHLDIRDFYTRNLAEAEIWTEREFAEYFCPKDCKLVEITIAEGDLEQENKRLAEKVVEINWENNKLLKALDRHYKDYPQFTIDREIKRGEYEERMREIDELYGETALHWGDEENWHKSADDLLCQILRDEGFEEIVNWFQKGRKWYC